MIPAYARGAHRRLRAKLAEMAAWNEKFSFNHIYSPETEGEVSGKKAELGIITSGIAFQHVREAAPGAVVLKLGMTYPLPMGLIRDFAASVKRCMVIEEGGPFSGRCDSGGGY